MNIFWHEAKSEINFLLSLSGYPCQVTKNDGVEFDIQLDGAHSLDDGTVAITYYPWDDDAGEADESDDPAELSCEEIKELAIY